MYRIYVLIDNAYIRMMPRDEQLNPNVIINYYCEEHLQNFLSQCIILCSHRCCFIYLLKGYVLSG